VPSWLDYAKSSEKIANDNLETQIAFAAICKTDTVYPYGCNSFHSKVAQSFNLSVSPNIAGFTDYQRRYTKVWYTIDEEKLNKDVAPLQDELTKLNSEVSTLKDSLPNLKDTLDKNNKYIDALKKDNGLMDDYINNHSEELKKLTEKIQTQQTINTVVTIITAVGVGIGCTAAIAATAGAAVLACVAIGGAMVAGAGNLNSQLISNGADYSRVNYTEVGVNAAIGGVTNLIAPGVSGGLANAGVKGIANAAATGVILGGTSGGALDFGTQLSRNGVNLTTVNYGSVLTSTVDGAILGGATGTAIGGVNQVASSKVNPGTAVDELAGNSTGKTVTVEAVCQPINGRMPINSKYAGQEFPLPDALKAKYPLGVRFTDDSFPDFSNYVENEVIIKYTGNRRLDKKLSNQQAGYTKTPSGYTWHHVEDTQTMQLIPADLHNAVNHTGGFAIHKSNN
jgi:Skp family chaperone for outer membrane proteins